MPSIRFSRADFVESFSSDSYRMITRTSLVKDSAPKQIFFIEAFSWQVWIAVLALGVLIMIITLFDRNFAPAPPFTQLPLNEHSRFQRARYTIMKSKIPYRIRQAFFNTMMRLVAQSPEGQDNHKRGTKQRFISVISILIDFFLVTVFQASVTVQVLVTVPMSVFESIEDVQTCRIPADRICIPHDDAAEQFWYQAIAPSQ